MKSIKKNRNENYFVCSFCILFMNINICASPKYPYLNSKISIDHRFAGAINLVYQNNENYGIILKTMTWGFCFSKTKDSRFLMLMIEVIIPPLQGSIIDLWKITAPSAVHVSFVLPLITFVVNSIFEYRSYNYQSTISNE